MLECIHSKLKFFMKRERIVKRMDQSVENILRLIEGLPSEKRRAVCWLINHIDDVEEMLAEEPFTEEELERYVERAAKTGDSYLRVILLYQKAKNRVRENRKPSQAPNHSKREE